MKINYTRGRPVKVFGCPVVQVKITSVNQKGRRYDRLTFVFYSEIIDQLNLTIGNKFQITVVNNGFILQHWYEGFTLQDAHRRHYIIKTQQDTDKIKPGYYKLEKEDKFYQSFTFVKFKK